MNTPQPTRSAASATPDHQQVTLVEDGFTPMFVDGRLVAVPLHPGSADSTRFVPAIVDGDVRPVPVYDPIAAALAAVAASARTPPAAEPDTPADDPGLPRAVRQCVQYGCGALLTAGAATWMIGEGVGSVAPYADQIGKILMLTAVTGGVIVGGLVLLLGRLRAVTAAPDGGTATASGDNSTATGAVFALTYRPQHNVRTTNIGKQSAGWRGSITNNG
ncbi:hypothetical protein [Kitasatospora sp. NPDC088134]|uniref:hypothetical protein n=1 Tax=Kitasatospora sp. NPDC088134 TaxID=3364071 RepID=UPI0038173FB8